MHVSTTLVLGWINFPNLRPKLPAFDIDSELFDLGKFIAAGLSVLKEASNVSVAIFVEPFRSIFVLSEYLDIDLWQCFSVLFASDLEFTERFQNANLEVAGVESLEVLLVFSSDFDNQVFVEKLIRQGHLLDHILTNSLMLWNCWISIEHLFLS